MFVISQRCLSRVLYNHRVGFPVSVRCFSRIKSAASTKDKAEKFSIKSAAITEDKAEKFISKYGAFVGLVGGIVTILGGMAGFYFSLKNEIKADVKERIDATNVNIEKQMDRWLERVLAKEQAQDKFIEAHGKLIEGHDRRIESMPKSKGWLTFGG